MTDLERERERERVGALECERVFTQTRGKSKFYLYLIRPQSLKAFCRKNIHQPLLPSNAFRYTSYVHQGMGKCVSEPTSSQSLSRCWSTVWPDLAIFWTLDNFLKPLATIYLPRYLNILRQFFVKVLKSIIFVVKSFLGNFYWHLAIFFLVTLPTT